MRTRRVGGMTCGIACITFGFMFLLHSFTQMISYEMIFKFWPLILVSMGMEFIFSNLKQKQDCESRYIYDKGAIVLLLLLSFFAVCMGYLEFLMEYGKMHIVL